MKVTLERVYLETETLGSIYVDGVLMCKCMELPWKDNKRGVSCIREGIHRVLRESWSPKHEYPHFRLPDVEGRTGILIHKITYVSGLRGCIGAGEAFKDLNGDQVPDIIGSTIALEKFYAAMPDQFEMEIKKKPI